MDHVMQDLFASLDAIKEGTSSVKKLKSLIDVAANRALSKDELAEATSAINTVELSLYQLAQ